MKYRYLLEKVAALEVLDGHRVRAVFADGFTGEVDLAPLLDCGPIFQPLRQLGFFRCVKVSDGVPEWSDDLDLSPGSLRAWCEAGRFLDWEQTDAWIEQHSRQAQGAA